VLGAHRCHQCPPLSVVLPPHRCRLVIAGSGPTSPVVTPHPSLGARRCCRQLPMSLRAHLPRWSFPLATSDPSSSLGTAPCWRWFLLAGGGSSSLTVTPHCHWSLLRQWWSLLIGGGSPSPGMAGPIIVVGASWVLLLLPRLPPGWLLYPLLLCFPSFLGACLACAGVHPVSAGTPPAVASPSQLCRNNAKLVKKKQRKKTNIHMACPCFASLSYPPGLLVVGA
jgi:hypothetical protein